jgi:hypothetical protein
MKKKEITIRVNAEFAPVFEEVSEEKRHKMEALLNLKLGEVMRQKPPLEEIMSEISGKAQERGLTSKALDFLLNE